MSTRSVNNQLELTNSRNVVIGAPGRNRTCDTRIRNPVLYPLSYGGIYVMWVWSFLNN